MTGALGYQDAGESRQTNAVYNNIYNVTSQEDTEG
jgi:hypothetical protein